MTDSALYLFKAARRPLYRKENLHLLAAERGTVVELAWRRSWTAPEYYDEGSIARGTRAYVLLTDRPYALFVPVREAEVVEAIHDDLFLRLRIMLGCRVVVEDRNLTEFTRLVRETDPVRVPGEKFVAPKRDGVDLVECFDEREDEAWRRAVDGVLRMSRDSFDRPYRTSVFFRPVGLRLQGDEEPAAARQTPLEPGAAASLVLRFYNPHLADRDLAGLGLRVLAPEDSLRVRAPERFPATGDVELELQATGPEPELTVQIAPAPAEHTSFTARFASRSRGGGVRPAVSADAAAAVDSRSAGALPSRQALPTDTAAGEAPPAGASVPASEVLRLYEFVRRRARFDHPDDEIDLSDAFARLLPHEQRIAEDRALTLCRSGSVDEGYRVLRALDPELLGDAGRFTLFRLTLQRESGPNPALLLENLDLAAEGRFARLLDELERLDRRSLGRLLPALAAGLPVEQLRPVMESAGARLETPAAIAATAEALYLSSGDAAWAFQYLSERRSTLRLSDPVVIETLLELSAASGRGDYDPELAEDVARRITNLVELDRLEQALPILRKTQQGLRRSERDRLYHRVADRLAAGNRFEAAAGIMVELADAACVTGDLEAANSAVQRARGLWARAGGEAGASSPEWLAQAIARVEGAWRACEGLAEWRKSEEERLRESLHARFLNRRILIAGGLRRPEWQEKLRELTGAEVDWAERYQAEGDNLERFAARIQAGHYDLVVHLWQKTGHEVQDRLKDACVAAGVPWAAATSVGVRGVVEGVVGSVAGD